MPDPSIDPRVEALARFIESEDLDSAGWLNITDGYRRLLLDRATRMLAEADAVDPVRAALRGVNAHV